MVEAGLVGVTVAVLVEEAVTGIVVKPWAGVAVVKMVLRLNSKQVTPATTSYLNRLVSELVASVGSSLAKHRLM